MGIIARMLSAGEMQVKNKSYAHRSSFRLRMPVVVLLVQNLYQEKIVEPTAKKLKSALGFPRMFIYLSSSDDDQTCPKSVF